MNPICTRFRCYLALRRYSIPRGRALRWALNPSPDWREVLRLLARYGKMWDGMDLPPVDKLRTAELTAKILHRSRNLRVCRGVEGDGAERIRAGANSVDKPEKGECAPPLP